MILARFNLLASTATGCFGPDIWQWLSTCHPNSLKEGIILLDDFVATSPCVVIFNLMAEQFLEDAPYVNVTADAATLLCQVTWKNYAPSGTYRRTLDMAAKCIEDNELAYFLTDQRRRGAILHEDEAWLLQDWCPRMARTRLKRAAIIQSADFFNRSTIERVVSAVQATAPFPIRFFRNYEEAQHWLMTGEDLAIPVVEG